MKRTVFASTSILVAIAGSAMADLTNNQVPQIGQPDVFGGYPTTHVMARFAPGSVPMTDKPVSASRPIQQIYAKYGVTSITPVIGYPIGDPDLAGKLGLDRWFNLNVPQGTNVRGLISELKGFNGTFEIVELDGIGGTANTPNDPEYPVCWGQNNTGGAYSCGGTGVANADVNAPQAWDLWTGGSDITLAVIDSGVTNHVDFAGKYVGGWNTVLNNNTDITDASCPHGTHCAGTAAANGNNGIGVAGMSWGAKIMAVKVLTGCGGVEQDCGEGIMWAADNGANVGTMSLQYYTGSQFFQDAVKYGHDKGMVLIAANGNNAGNIIAFPAKYPFCMGVGATTISDGIAGFSNTGPEVDVSAPGQDVWSSLNANGYACYSGTSMATPHVAGTACLLWSYNKGLSNQQVIDAIIKGVKDLGAPGFDQQFGWGRIDAFKILNENVPGLNIFVVDPVPALVAPGVPQSFKTQISVGPDTLVVGSEKLFYRTTNSGPFTQLPLQLVSTGIYNANLPAFDCGDSPEFYVQAEGASSGIKTSPFGAPGNTLKYAIGTVQTTQILNEGFNSGLPSGWSATGLWNITSSCNSGSSCNGGSFAYYGISGSCTFNNGGTNNGSLKAPAVDLLATGGKLEFCYRYDGEGGSPYDRASVRVNGAEVWAAAGTTLAWTPVSVDLPVAGAGAVIEFYFDTVDGIANDSLGFQVDGVKVTASKIVCDSACYADCDGSGTLNIDDFICFQTNYALGDPSADCDGSGNLNIDDFICFQTFYALGC